MRKLSLGPFERTFNAESLPLLDVALFWSIQASASACTVTGGPQSTVGMLSNAHWWVAGVGSTLPSRSIARTANVCSPWDRPVNRCGAAQPTNSSPSREHSKRAPNSLPTEENSNVADARTVTVRGASVIVVSGGSLSTGGAPPGRHTTPKHWLDSELPDAVLNPPSIVPVPA